MTVQELIEELEGYGEHLPVALVIEKGNRTEVYPEYLGQATGDTPVELRVWQA